MKIKLKINNVQNYSGFVIIDSDAYGKPLSKFWRQRLKDAQTDNCVEPVPPKPKPKPKARKVEK